MATATLTASSPARRRRPRGGGADESPRLFGDEPSAAVAPPAAPASAPVASLADLVAATWSGLVTAAGPVPCLVCGAELIPRRSAGAGVVGGCCDGCGTTLE